MGLQHPSRRFRADVEGLRAYAVGLVVLDHLGLWPHGGFVGVDAFFVISGFLITGLVVDEIERTGTLSLTGFYLRRARRILPAALVVLALTAVAAHQVLDASRADQTDRDIGWAAAFAANVHQVVQGTSYLHAYDPPSLVQHYWSLAVEEQFYLVWPLLLLGVVVAARRLSLVPRHLLTAVIVLVSLGSFAWCVHQTGADPDGAYFGTVGRGWELTVGAAVALAVRQGRQVRAKWAGPAGLAGLLGLIGSAAGLGPDSRFPGPGALWPVLATALVLLAGATGASGAWLAPLTNPVARYVGRLSFSLYLVHWPVILLVGALVRPGTWVRQPLACVVVAAVTLLVHHLVEVPGHRGVRGVRGLARGASLRAAATATVVLLAATLLLWNARSGDPAPPVLSAAAVGGPTVAFAATTSDLMTYSATTQLRRQVVAALAAGGWPALTPSFATLFDRPANGYGIEACDVDAAPLASDDACRVGRPDAPKRAVIVGDSVAEALVPAFREIVKTATDWQVRYVGMTGCDFVDLDRAGASPLSLATNCVARTRVTADYIRTTHPDLVIYSGRFFGSSAVTDTAGDPVTSADWLAGWTRYLDSLGLVPGQLLLVSAPPVQQDIRTCYTPSSVPATCVTRVPQPWLTFFDGVSDLAEQEGGQLIDLRQLICVSDLCPAFVATVPARRDRIHLSPEMSVLIAPALHEQLRALGLFVS
jgi:peptidoglycan/LPS O-acetylase OafA/YrhL